MECVINEVRRIYKTIWGRELSPNSVFNIKRVGDDGYLVIVNEYGNVTWEVFIPMKDGMKN